ncbi:MAG: transcriptional repressor NrdR [Clostridia bacterium]|nr:transcriptional repressor NrdR [Clostridia bacterium]
MKCPYCGSRDNKVIDSRSIEENSSIRRRRECSKCQARFNTFETVETIQIMVKKKDGSREYFDKTKMLSGIVKACQKRPVDSIAIANKVESDILNSMKQEISSQEIGELIMKELKDADAVAYVRFASIYRDFQDVETFMKELRKFLKI